MKVFIDPKTSLPRESGVFGHPAIQEAPMPISLQLTDEESRRLEEAARVWAVDPRELALAAIRDLVARPRDDFEGAVSHVLGKNEELYRRLAL